MAACRSGLSRVTFYFAPDEFHKAGYSGGENYHLTLPDASADFHILGMYGLDEPFVEHLRASLTGGGFRGKLEPPDATDAAQLYKAAPRSALIDSLARNVEPI